MSDWPGYPYVTWSSTTNPYQIEIKDIRLSNNIKLL